MTPESFDAARIERSRTPISAGKSVAPVRSTAAVPTARATSADTTRSSLAPTRTTRAPSRAWSALASAANRSGAQRFAGP